MSENAVLVYANAFEDSYITKIPYEHKDLDDFLQ